MSIELYSTKKFKYLPCGHAQFFDKEPDGSPGECASVHGYDREVELTFAGDIDQMGWLVGFGELNDVKEFIEYYFDHVTVLPANDPRLNQITEEMMAPGGLLGTIRILPAGVSMEMSSLFIWEHVNHYIVNLTNGRCYVKKVHVLEHDRNSGFLEVDRETAIKSANQKNANQDNTLPKKQVWDLETPQDMLKRLNCL